MLFLHTRKYGRYPGCFAAEQNSKEQSRGRKYLYYLSSILQEKV